MRVGKGVVMTTPRTIPSPDDAPCGSLLRFMDAGEGPDLVVRLADGTGWYVGYGTSVADEEDGRGWEWGKPYGPTGEVVVLAEGLTAEECVSLSGMAADEALAWCSARAAAQESK